MLVVPAAENHVTLTLTDIMRMQFVEGGIELTAVIEHSGEKPRYATYKGHTRRIRRSKKIKSPHGDQLILTIKI